MIIQELSGLKELLNCHQTHLSLTSTTSASVHCLKMDGSTFLKVKKRPGKTTTPQINTCNILSRYKTWSDVLSKTRYRVKIAALSWCGQGSIRAAVPLPQQRSLYCTHTNNGGGVRWLIALHSCFTSGDQRVFCYMLRFVNWRPILACDIYLSVMRNCMNVHRND